MAGMKISISLPRTDVEFLDEYSARTSAESRSAVIQAAIGLLREAELEADYAAAWEEWDAGTDAPLWDRVTADGLGADATR